MKKKNNSLFDKQLVNTSLVEAFRKLDPRTMIKNPIMFTVELVTAIMLLMLFYIAFTGDQSQGSFGYNLAIFFVLLLTIQIEIQSRQSGENHRQQDYHHSVTPNGFLHGRTAIVIVAVVLRRVVTVFVLFHSV